MVQTPYWRAFFASNTQPEHQKIRTLDDLLTKDSSSLTASSKDSGSGLELLTVAGLRLPRNHQRTSEERGIVASVIDLML